VTTVIELSGIEHRGSGINPECAPALSPATYTAADHPPDNLPEARATVNMTPPSLSFRSQSGAVSAPLASWFQDPLQLASIAFRHWSSAACSFHEAMLAWQQLSLHSLDLLDDARRIRVHATEFAWHMSRLGQLQTDARQSASNITASPASAMPALTCMLALAGSAAAVYGRPR
jgi:hypothetical protein